MIFSRRKFYRLNSRMVALSLLWHLELIGVDSPPRPAQLSKQIARWNLRVKRKDKLSASTGYMPIDNTIDLMASNEEPPDRRVASQAVSCSTVLQSSKNGNKNLCLPIMDPRCYSPEGIGQMVGDNATSKIAHPVFNAAVHSHVGDIPRPSPCEEGSSPRYEKWSSWREIAVAADCFAAAGCLFDALDLFHSCFQRIAVLTNRLLRNHRKCMVPIEDQYIISDETLGRVIAHSIPILRILTKAVICSARVCPSMNLSEHMDLLLDAALSTIASVAALFGIYEEHIGEICRPNHTLHSEPRGAADTASADQTITGRFSLLEKAINALDWEYTERPFCSVSSLRWQVAGLSQAKLPGRGSRATSPTRSVSSIGCKTIVSSYTIKTSSSMSEDTRGFRHDARRYRANEVYQRNYAPEQPQVPPSRSSEMEFEGISGMPTRPPLPDVMDDGAY